MKLTLEPLLSEEIMKITPEKEAYFYLYDKGFTENEIEYIKNCNEKEGIPFCVKTFTPDNLEEVKKELREEMKKNTMKKYIHKFIDKYSNIINTNVKHY